MNQIKPYKRGCVLHTRQPEFLLVGVPKAGTTSMSAALGRHPEIYIPEKKELHYFNSDKVKNLVPHCIDTEEKYIKQFCHANPNQICGEASVFYFVYAYITIPRIISMLGKSVKIMVILRNPIDRAYSAYLYTSALNTHENRTFISSIEYERKFGYRENVSPMLNYLECGMYAKNLKLWMKYFPNIHVMLFDDLKTNSNLVISDATRFLGLVPSVLQENAPIKNTSPGKWANIKLGFLIKLLATKTIRKWGKNIAPGYYEKFRKVIFNSLMRKPPKISDSDKKYLIDIYKEDIIETGKVINRDLSSWIL